MKLVENTIDVWIEKARRIATIAHKDQKRKGGEPYITHPIRVANAVEDRSKPIAFLHDVIEDTNITIEDLKEEGFPSYIIDAIKLLTHDVADTNLVYWNKILTNPDAVKVKLADIKDNLNSEPSEHAKKKYAIALDLFRRAGYE